MKTIKYFVKKLWKYGLPGELSYKTKDNYLYDFTWTDGYSDYGFTIILPCCKNKAKGDARMYVQEILDIQERDYSRWARYEERKSYLRSKLRPGELL